MSFLSRFSKNQIAIVSVVLGLVLIFFLNPPYTVCDAQRELLREKYKRFLNWINEDETPLIQKKPQWKKLFKSCQSTNHRGGCYEFFRQTRAFVMDLNQLPKKCVLPIVKGENKIQNFLWSAVKLMIYLAWNSKNQDDSYGAQAWFDEEEVFLFCRLKKSLKSYFPENWILFKKTLIQELVKDKDSPKERAYDLSLFSLSCSRF